MISGATITSALGLFGSSKVNAMTDGFDMVSKVTSKVPGSQGSATGAIDNLLFGEAFDDANTAWEKGAAMAHSFFVLPLIMGVCPVAALAIIGIDAGAELKRGQTGSFIQKLIEFGLSAVTFGGGKALIAAFTRFGRLGRATKKINTLRASILTKAATKAEEKGIQAVVSSEIFAGTSKVVHPWYRKLFGLGPKTIYKSKVPKSIADGLKGVKDIERLAKTKPELAKKMMDVYQPVFKQNYKSLAIEAKPRFAILSKRMKLIKNAKKEQGVEIIRTLKKNYKLKVNGFANNELVKEAAGVGGAKKIASTLLGGPTGKTLAVAGGAAVATAAFTGAGSSNTTVIQRSPVNLGAH